MTLIKERFEEAKAKKEADYTTFTWKGAKAEYNGQFVQKEVKMVDMSIRELLNCVKHCNSMLYNDDLDNPGRHVLLDIITEQRTKCNCELFLRWLEETAEMSRYAFLVSLKEFIENNPGIDPTTSPIEHAVGGCPKDFSKLPMSMVLDGCTDELGKFSRQHITLTFLLKQGIWFSADETKEMNKKGVEDKLEYARKYLEVKPNSSLRLSPKGLSLAQMQAMITLRSKKFSDLTTMQLELLRNKVLFSLEKEVRFHISQWETRLQQLERVLQAKGVDL